MSQPRSGRSENGDSAGGSPGRRPVALGRLLPAVAIGAAVIGCLAAAGGLGTSHIVLVTISLVVFALVFCALTAGVVPRGHRRMLTILAFVAICVGAWASSPAGPTVATKSPRHKPDIFQPPKPAARLGRQIALGVRPRELVATSDRLWALTNTGVASFNPRVATEPLEAFAVSGRPSYIAADTSRVAVVRGGWVSVYSARSEVQIGPALHFSEAAGPVAIAFGSVWLCNRTHSKLDRLDLRTRTLTPISVPGVPLDMLVVGRYIWVSIEAGWLVRVDPAANAVVASFRTEAEPQALAWGLGSLWITHPSLRRVTRMNPANGAEIGSPIPVASDTNVLVVADQSVWAISGSIDVLQRIDPQRQQVTASVSLPAEPSGLAYFNGQLFVTSASVGTLVPIAIE